MDHFLSKMKYSEALIQKSIIDNWDLSQEIKDLKNKLAVMTADIKNIELENLESRLNQLNNDTKEILSNLEKILDDIQKTKDDAKKELIKLSKEPLSKSYDIYDEYIKKGWNNPDVISSYRKYDLFLDDEDRKKFDSFIKKYVSWQHPTLYIRPNSLHFVDSLKASDILYIAEEAEIRPWLYKNLSKRFFESIRFKFIDESKENFLIEKFPAGQIGFILMENFLNFKPFDVIRQYLDESFLLLKPGGHIMFTYNNCDLASGVRNFENGLYCFTPGDLLKEICEASGFKIEYSESNDNVSWLVLKKPGELTSIKGGKALGQIIFDRNYRNT